MKHLKYFFLIQASLFILVASAFAGDFDWLKELDMEVKADASGFRTRLETRFEAGDVKVNAVLGNVARPADAYMVLRLGELSGLTIKTVLKEYKKSRGKGWGVMAKNLGIKPGSGAFHALKAGHDLDGGGGKGKVKGNDNRGKGKNKEGKGRK
ncbi:MAG: hypothetical protein RQ824_07295 [bacterium]|nr:hypothetical protein [bacterium]